MRRNEMGMSRIALLTVFAVSLCALAAGPSGATPLMFGSLDRERAQARDEAETVIEDLGLNISINDASIIRIGSGFAVDEDETIEGDVIVIGGGLTVEGRIEGDAAVIGGSMYLGSTCVIGGDAVVVAGILEKEEGSIVKGKIVERPEAEVYTGKGLAGLEDLKRLEELERLEQLEELEAYEIESEEGIVRVGKDIHIEAGEIVTDDVVAIGGDIYIDGRVDGDVVATAGDIYLSSTAEVTGDIVATFGSIEIEEGAVTEGEVVEIDLGGKRAISSMIPGEKPSKKTTYIISLYRPDADEVRLTGSWIDWDPEGIKMKEDGGNWATTVSLGPGTHLYEFIVDGEWMADPDIDTKVPDGMGGYATPIHIFPRGAKDVLITFSLDRPDADDVRVTGTWNDWDPEGMKMLLKEGGKWTITVPLAPGSYLYKFYIDDMWVPDPDVDQRYHDGMGGYATPLYVKPAKGKYTTIIFSLARPDLEDVRVTGTWNDWDSEGIRMGKDTEGTWRVMVPLPPGTHKYKFYIDGEWVPDPDVKKHVPDGRGGFATEFVVKPPKKTFKSMTRKKKKGTDIEPAIDYNRVDGFYIALIAKNETNVFPLPRFDLEGGYSKKRDRWLYSFEIEQPVAAFNMFSVGGSIYDKTDSYDDEIITDVENFLAASFVKKDYKDYFDRRGATGFVTLRPMKPHMIKISYSSDEYRPLDKRTDTALFRKSKDFAPNPHNFDQICYDPEKDAKVCNKVRLKSIDATYEFDTRDCTETPSTGLWLRLMGEWAGGDLGGDLAYDRYIADVRHYNKISPKQMIALRLKAGMMDVGEDSQCPCAPPPEYFFPKLFYVGGIGTMPGYDFKEFRGTHMLLANLEYTYLVKDKLGVVFFSDGGDSRGRGEPSDDVWDQIKFKFDAGVGIRYEDPGDHTFTLSVAKPLDDLDRPVSMAVRVSRMF